MPSRLRRRVIWPCSMPRKQPGATIFRQPSTTCVTKPSTPRRQRSGGSLPTTTPRGYMRNGPKGAEALKNCNGYRPTLLPCLHITWPRFLHGRLTHGAPINAHVAKHRPAINRDLTTLKSVLSKALTWGVIDAHPLTSLKPLKVDKHARIRYLTDEEEHRVETSSMLS